MLPQEKCQIHETRGDLLTLKVARQNAAMCQMIKALKMSEEYPRLFIRRG